MINIVIAYDDNDFDLGEYFEDSFNHINDVITILDNVTSTSIRGLDCTELNINSAVQLINANPFIFVGLSHGDEKGTCLLTDNDKFVSSSNTSHFNNSLFYTTACNAAIRLGYELRDNNCRCFIGCDKSSYATFEEFHDIYIACENYSLNEFLKSDKTIGNTFSEMKDYFDEQIIHYSAIGEILFVMELEHNKDCMVMLGDDTLTRDDLSA